MIKQAIIAKINPKFTAEPLKNSVIAAIFKDAVSAIVADSVEYFPGINVFTAYCTLHSAI